MRRKVSLNEGDGGIFLMSEFRTIFRKSNYKN